MGSPRPSPSSACPDVLALAIAAALLGATGAAGASAGASANASPGAGAHVSLAEPLKPIAATDEQRLFLEIFHGDRPIELIAEILLRSERFWATPQELREIGVVVSPTVTPDADGRVPLDALPGLSWRYDPAAQRLHLDIPAELRPQQSLGYRPPAPVAAERPPGFRLGYDAYAQHRDDFSSLAVGTALGWFGRFGTFEFDGIGRFGDTDVDGTERWTRLDTRWTYSDPARMWTWTAGDLISGGVAWSRPVRLGGVQWRRNFATRPDLVTMPLPRFSADATLPSAVELYVDNVQRF